VNNIEQYVKNALQKEGWNVMQKGYPDFLCYKTINNKLTIQFIEVKSGRDRLTVDQRKMKEILEKVGIKVSVYYIEESAIKSVDFTCSRCGRNIPNNTKYCGECNDITRKERDAEYHRRKRAEGGYDIYKEHKTEQSSKNKEYLKTWILDENRCECSKKKQNIAYDFEHGDAVCNDCGLIVGRLYLG